MTWNPLALRDVEGRLGRLDLVCRSHPDILGALGIAGEWSPRDRLVRETACCIGLFYLAARRRSPPKGMLAGRPAFEAWGIIDARARAARLRVNTIAGWVHVVADGLRVDLAALPAVDGIELLRWARTTDLHHTDLLDDTLLTEALQLARLAVDRLGEALQLAFPGRADANRERGLPDHLNLPR